MGKSFPTLALISVLCFSGCSTETDPSAARDYIALGDRLMSDGKYLQARAQYTKAMEANPESAVAHLRRAIASRHAHGARQIAIAKGHQGVLLVGSSALELAICLDPNLIEAYLVRGEMYEELARNSELSGYERMYGVAKAEYEEGLSRSTDGGDPQLV